MIFILDEKAEYQRRIRTNSFVNVWEKNNFRTKKQIAGSSKTFQEWSYLPLKLVNKLEALA